MNDVKEKEKALETVEWADAVLADDKASAKDKEKARKIADGQEQILKSLTNDIDDILDIEDDDEREKAFDEWYDSMDAEATK